MVKKHKKNGGQGIEDQRSASIKINLNKTTKNVSEGENTELGGGYVPGGNPKEKTRKNVRKFLSQRGGKSFNKGGENLEDQSDKQNRT